MKKIYIIFLVIPILCGFSWEFSKNLDLVCTGNSFFTNLKTGYEIKENKTETYTFEDGKWRGIYKVDWSREKISYFDPPDPNCRVLCNKTLNIDRISGVVIETSWTYARGTTYESKFEGKCVKSSQKF
jgi:hypothetical protein